tara:strand:+ start:11 stop:460 length:450 start_codon:yes stop_codon:yes gene_type:complete
MAHVVGKRGELSSKTKDKSDGKKIGINVPVTKSDLSNDGYFDNSYTTYDAIKTDLVNLLNTEKGERLMQPNLGLNLKQFLFNPLDESSQRMMQDEITNSVKFWLPYVNIQKMDVFYDEDSMNSFKIKLNFTIGSDVNNLQSIEFLVQEN